MFSELAKKPVHEVFQRSKKIADVGVELEVEGYNLPSAVPHWSSKPEGSLQHGIEYITKPIKIEAVETYVDSLRSFIETNGGEIKPSYRCSTHIHVNVLPSLLSDALGFAVVFTMFEPLLLSLCGNQRDGNLFCMSSYDTGEIIVSFDNLCSALDKIHSRGFGFERGKYSALNFGRLIDLGTLEARCFPLSISGAQVSAWCRWLLNMRDLAADQSDKTYRSLWKQVRQSPNWHAEKIFGLQYHAVPNATNLIDMGTETAYELTRVLKKWYAKPAKEEKKMAFPKAKFGSSLSGSTLDAVIVDDPNW